MLLLTIVRAASMLAAAAAIPFPGFPKSENSQENPPKYEYQYDIKNDKGVGQGKTEIRDGVLAAGRYYVEGKNSSQSVEYVADDWGYHPYVEFQNSGPYSQTITQIALDKEAMKMLNKKNTKEQPSESTQENNNHELVNQEKDVSIQTQNEYQQEYAPPEATPQNEYFYLNQDSKFVYVPQEPKNTVFLQPVLYDEVLPVEYHNQHLQQNVENYENFPLYQNSPNNVFKPSKIRYFDHFLQYDRPGGYGSKFNNDDRQNNVRFLNRVKDLVSGQDVLDINTAVDTEMEDENQETPVEASSALPEMTKTSQTDSSSTKDSTEPEHSEEGKQSLLDQPIVVRDSENLLENCQPDTEAPSTVIVTPKPISNALSTSVKVPPENGTPTKSTHQRYVVDVKKSIPFYLGKVEYYDNVDNKMKNATASATQHIQLLDLLQRPIIEKQKAPVNKSAANNFSQSAKSEVSKGGSAQKSDAKYVAQESKIENPILVPIHVEKFSIAPRNIEGSSLKYANTQVTIPIVISNQQTPRQSAQVEKKVPVPQYVETPVPVQKSVEEFVHAPVTVQVPVPVSQTFYLPIEIPKPYPVELAKLVIPTSHSLPAQHTRHTQVTVEPAKITKLVPASKSPKRLKSQDQDRYAYAGSVQSYTKVPCIDLRLFGERRPYCPKMNNNNYIGLVPPKVQAPYHYNITNSVSRKQRTAREGLFDNIRWEYGFMPPLIPSLAIDEHGNPVDKHTK